MHVGDGFPTSPRSFLSSLRRHRELVWQLTRQEVAGRYRGSAFGLLWTLLTPLLMLAVYTFVFSVVFGARWGGMGEGGRSQFAVVLFAGLAVFSLFADCIGRSPTLVVHNANYVKRVVFPLEMLPVVAMGNAVFHFACSMLVWMGVALLVLGRLPWTAALLPLAVLPLLLGTLGLSWLLASLGVFLRDIGQFIGIVVTGLMFLSPIFYPLDAVPENFRIVVQLNPIGHVVQMARDVLVFGRVPDAGSWCLAMAIGAGLAWAGYWWFQKTRKGFADVL